MPRNQIDYIVSKLKRKSDDKKLRILLTSTHPHTDTTICLTGHEFYNLVDSKFPIKWPSNLPIPPNMHLISSLDEIPEGIDLILSQNVVDQYQAFKGLSYTLDIPLVELEHTLPTAQWVEAGIPEQLKNQIKAEGYVYITDYSRKAWKREDEGTVIYHTIDSEKFKGWLGGNKRVMTLVNSFKSREWAVGSPIDFMLKSPIIDLFGNNPGFNSKPLSQNEVISTMTDYDCFLNTSLRSPIPVSILEAASMSMPIVSTKTCAIPEFFEHEKSILFYETVDEALVCIDRILTDKKFAKTLGENARKVILDKFSKERYVNDWNNVFKKALEVYNSR